MSTAAAGTVELRNRIKSLVIESARLKMDPSALGDDQPLFEEKGGLGLDSIDVLELVVTLEKNYKISLQDREAGRKVLRSVSSIVEFIQSSGRQP